MTDIAARTAHGLELALDRGGWTCTNLDVNVTTATVRMDLRRVDGLHVTLDIRNGSASITREQVVWVDSPSRYGGRWQTHLLGRVTKTTPKEAVDALAAYLVENGCGQATLRGDLHRALGVPGFTNL